MFQQFPFYAIYSMRLSISYGFYTIYPLQAKCIMFLWCNCTMHFLWTSCLFLLPVLHNAWFSTHRAGWRGSDEYTFQDSSKLFEKGGAEVQKKKNWAFSKGGRVKLVVSSVNLPIFLDILVKKGGGMAPLGPTLVMAPHLETSTK